MTAHNDPSFRDGWGPGAFDTDDWRPGDRDTDEMWRQTVSEDRPGLRGWPLVGNIALWIAAFIGTSFVGFVFGVMIVRSFL